VTARVPTPHLVPPAALRPFLVSRGGDIVLDYTEETPPLPSAGDRLFESGGVWTVYRHGRGLLYTFETPVLDPPLYKAVVIDSRLRRGRLFFPRPRRGRRPAWALAYPLDELLFQHRLATFEGGAEVHAFGVVHRGRALLFCGHSGAGKTTLTRIWRRARPNDLVLSDDRVIVRSAGRRLLAHGTPWHGEGAFSDPARVPLGAVFFLHQDRTNRVLPLGRAAAAAHLFSRSFPPPWSGPAVSRVLRLCEAVSSRAPCFDLRFRRDQGAVLAACAALPF
jgi:hypothetical protein